MIAAWKYGLPKNQTMISPKHQSARVPKKPHSENNHFYPSITAPRTFTGKSETPSINKTINQQILQPNAEQHQSKQHIDSKDFLLLIKVKGKILKKSVTANMKKTIIKQIVQGDSEQNLNMPPVKFCHKRPTPIKQPHAKKKTKLSFPLTFVPSSLVQEKAKLNQELATFFTPSPEELQICRTQRNMRTLESFYDNMAQLHDFRQLNGHCRVPQQTGKLANW